MPFFFQLSLLTEQRQLIGTDPFGALSREVSFKVLAYLNATSVCRTAQVGKEWANDGMCVCCLYCMNYLPCSLNVASGSF